MFAENIDHAGDAARKRVHRSYRVRFKDGVSIGTGNAQPFADITLGLLGCQRGGPAANGDALSKLAEFVTFELYFQLGLTGEDDLQEFLSRRLKIQEQSNLFQRGRIKPLRLIHNQYRNLAGAVLL